jgi:hypothetical protein
VSTNGSQPRHRGKRLPGSRRVHLVAGVATALVLAGVLVAPVVLLSGGSPKTRSCRGSILYNGRHYVARPTGRVVEAIAVGVGLVTGCGNEPANVDLRSVARVKPSLAVALASDPSVVYVQRGVCPRLARAALLRCLRARVAVVATGSLPQ